MKKRAKNILLVSVFLVIATACQESTSQQSVKEDSAKPKLLSDYVRTPLNKAAAIDSQAQERNAKINKALTE